MALLLGLPGKVLALSMKDLLIWLAISLTISAFILHLEARAHKAHLSRMRAR